MDDTREEMRKLIDVIEKGAKSTSVEQAVDDIKLFANTASFLANALDTRLKSKDAKPRRSQNQQRLWGNQNHQCLVSQNPQNHQSRKSPKPACPVQSARQSHKQIMTGSSHRQHKHLSEPVRNQHSLKTTSRTPLKHYSLRRL
jgi:hypothetical protein